MTVLGGDRDGTVTEEAVLETGRAYGAQVRIFSGTGHAGNGQILRNPEELLKHNLPDSIPLVGP
jgi:hypothetical protein